MIKILIIADDFTGALDTGVKLAAFGARTKVRTDIELNITAETDADVLVLCAEPIYPMTLMQVYPIGVMRMLDGGKMDDKIIAVPVSDPTYAGIDSIDSLPAHIFDEIMHFFSVYKQLENKQTAVKELFDRREAEEIIEMCVNQYNEKFAQ